ncbi:hypothetical protein QLQ85_17170 [Halomonas sp. M4R5S39]|nr:hypothetical protein [Halomonas kalidii]MDI5986527.1 hypothetical protein [Halomonas kalidii]
MRDGSALDIPVPSLPLIGILYAQLGWFSRRAEPEAPVGAVVAGNQA